METKEQYQVEYLDYIPPPWSKRRHKNIKHSVQQKCRANIVTQQTKQRQIKPCKIEITQKSSQQRENSNNKFEIRQGQTFEQIAKQMEQEQKLIQKQLKKNQDLSQKRISKDKINLNQAKQEQHTNKKDIDIQSAEEKSQKLNSEQFRMNETQSKKESLSLISSQATSEKQIKSQKESSQKEIKIGFCNFQIVLSQKNVNESLGDVLIILFQTHNLQYYPGSNIKDKLSNERQKLSKAEMFEGSIYIKNKHLVPNFKYLVFLKVKRNNLPVGICKGLNSLLLKSKKDRMQIKQIVFCWDENQIKIKELTQGISSSKQLKNCQIKVNLSIKNNIDLEVISKQIQNILLS